MDKCTKKIWTRAFVTKNNKPFIAWIRELILENTPPDKVTFDHGTDTGSKAIKGTIFNTLIAFRSNSIVQI